MIVCLQMAGCYTDPIAGTFALSNAGKDQLLPCTPSPGRHLVPSRASRASHRGVLRTLGREEFVGGARRCAAVVVFACVSLLAGCNRDFTSNGARAQVDADDAAVADLRTDVGKGYLDLGSGELDGSVLPRLIDCSVELERDGSVPKQGCATEDDWLCGRTCDRASRLLCLKADGSLLREIRCGDDGECYCYRAGSWSLCPGINSGRLGCIRAREALGAGCCQL
jgi:hypothetical protein